MNATGTFKARGMLAAPSRAKELGASSVTAPSAGNAAGAMAAYGAAAGLETAVFMPADAPEINRLESSDVSVYLVKGRISGVARIVQRVGNTDGSTFRS